MGKNYQLLSDAVMEGLRGERKSLLLQCCCGPCSTYVLEYLSRHFELTVLFYNPNIQPAEEYEKRLFWLKKVVSGYGGQVAFLDCPYEGEAFVQAARGFEREQEGGERCTRCFELRLRETARLAAERGFDYFCTTLTVSPHKDAERINEIGMSLEKEFGVSWLPSDFKKKEGYKRSVELARQQGLYRQDYCGCAFSLAEAKKRAEQRKAPASDEKDERGFYHEQK